jgi:hypothetical protein
LPRVPGFAEGFLSGPRQRKSLPRAALGIAVLTALHPLSRVGPSAGRDPRHNNVFVESQPSTGSAPSEKERRHIWAAVHYADGPAVRPSAQMLPVPRAPSPALGKGVDPGLTRLTGLCREPAGAVGRAHVCADGPRSAHAPLPRAPQGSRQRSIFFLVFGLNLFLC